MLSPFHVHFGLWLPLFLFSVSKNLVCIINRINNTERWVLTRGEGFFLAAEKGSSLFTLISQRGSHNQGVNQEFNEIRVVWVRKHLEAHPMGTVGAQGRFPSNRVRLLKNEGEKIQCYA